jgi:hypothetical protein
LYDAVTANTNVVIFLYGVWNNGTK